MFAETLCQTKSASLQFSDFGRQTYFSFLLEICKYNTIVGAAILVICDGLVSCLGELVLERWPCAGNHFTNA